MSTVGIDDIAIHVPRLYLDMRDFADLREATCDGLDPEVPQLCEDVYGGCVLPGVPSVGLLGEQIDAAFGDPTPWMMEEF